MSQRYREGNINFFKLSQKYFQDQLLRLLWFDNSNHSSRRSRRWLYQLLNIPYDKQKRKRNKIETNCQSKQVDIPSPVKLPKKSPQDSKQEINPHQYISYFNKEIFEPEQEYIDDQLSFETIKDHPIGQDNPNKAKKKKTHPDQKPKKKRIRKDWHNFSVQNRSTGLNRINQIFEQIRKKNFQISDFETFLEQNKALNSQIFLVYTFIFFRKIKGVTSDIYSSFKSEMKAYYKKRLAKILDTDKKLTLQKKINPNVELLDYLFPLKEKIDFDKIEEICERLLRQPRETNRQAKNHLYSPLRRAKELYDQIEVQSTSPALESQKILCQSVPTANKLSTLD